MARLKKASGRIRRSLSVKGQRRKPKSEVYAIYINDAVNAGGVKSPVFGTISRYTLDKLGLKLAELQKLPNGGKYTSAGGLSLDFDFKENLLWKTTKGRSGTVDFNSRTPVPLSSEKTKLTIAVKGTQTTGGAVGGAGTSSVAQKVTIGIPAATSASVVVNFVSDTLKLDKNPKVLWFKWGDGKITLQEFNTKAGKKREATPDWYIPVGYNVSTKRTNAGNISTANGASKKTLVVATICARSAKLLGFTAAATTSLAEIATGSKLNKSIDAAANDGRANAYQVFKELKVYSDVWVDSAQAEKAVLVSPGKAVSVKFRFKSRAGATRTGGVTTPTVKSGKTKGATTGSFSVPASTPIAVVFEMLMNCKQRVTSFQLSLDGKSYGNSYPLPTSRSAKVK